MQNLKFDFNNMFHFNIGNNHGITESDITNLLPTINKSHKHLRSLLDNRQNRINLGLEWAALPYQDELFIDEIQKLAREVGSKYENVLFLGIGGSFLGLRAAQDALARPYYNEFKPLRDGSPRVYFEGNNLDPEPVAALLKHLKPKKTFVVVISKSGETTETKAVFCVVQEWLKNGCGRSYGRQILCITDPKSGSLRQRVEEEQKKDSKSFRSFSLLPGVGGRFSEFNMGLFHLALIGVNIKELFTGAREMAKKCSAGNVYKNPAYLYAVLHYLAYLKKGKSIAIMMPFTESLKSTADWYCQLLAESLGKKYKRTIRVLSSGVEDWSPDKSRCVNVGRTPVATRGTTDLHSIQQNNIEGENNKAVTMIRVECFAHDARVSRDAGILSGKNLSDLLRLAQEATEWALVRDQRPNCTISMPNLSPANWGALLYFFEMATAFEGELLNVNAFDQPGVEGYKNYMYYKLRKPGISPAVAEEIKKHPVKRARKFII
ncbi:MAG: glucose-6-phosphate isomerase [Candidatus Omnitrophota bacterium]